MKVVKKLICVLLVIVFVVAMAPIASATSCASNFVSEVQSYVDFLFGVFFFGIVPEAPLHRQIAFLLCYFSSRIVPWDIFCRSYSGAQLCYRLILQ